MTGLPRPGAAMRAAMTTNESAAITVWLTPSTMSCLAIGSCTFTSVCHRVAPMDSDASMGAWLRLRMAWEVMRIEIGML